MLWLYRILFVPALVLSLPYYLLRMWRRGGYGRQFSNRFGAVEGLPAKRAGVRRIWLQAVSVGEMLAITPLLEAWRADPAVEVYLTTTTSTGFKIACEKYRGATAGIGYFPLDWWWFSARAWRAVRPDLVILTEGERWPEHLGQARARGVRVLCINARLSDRSFERMRGLRWAVRPLLGGITRVLACSELDAERFRELGFPAERITTTGNIKLDLTLTVLGSDEKAALRAELGLGREPVLLGSSTWPGEERVLVEVLKQLRAEGLAVRLLLVPRHAERRAEVEAVVRESGLAYHFRSRGAAPGPVEVCVADTTGELRRLTQVADLVFVGKSLPPHEQGQTPVEAAALGKAVLFGPGMTNFRAITGELVAGGAAKIVSGGAELAAEARRLLRDEMARAAMAEAAQAWHRANQGAVARTLDAVRAELERGA